MKKLLAGALALLLASTGAFAQTAAQSIDGFLLLQGNTYGSFTCPSTATSPCYVQYGASIPVTGTITPSGTQDVNQKQVNGATINVGVGAASTGTQRVTTSTDSTVGPSQRTLVTLDINTVTTGGTAVTAIAAGHRTAGGFLQNPKGATIDLCINEIGTATGTTSSGNTTCIIPGQTYTVSPASTGVSVITSDSSHPFSGYGLN